QSQIIVGLSNAAEVVAPTEQEGVVHFDIKQATLDQALRHSIDTSAFPSAVSTVTPYEVKTKYGTDVRVAVQLKGDATYVLEQDENLVKLVVDNGEYAVAMPAASENQELDVAESEDDFITDEDELVDADEGFVTEEDDFSDDDIDEDDEMDWGEEEDEDTASTMKAKAEKYTGEKISLVFDSADVRSILQLIGDVSGLNILASGDVGGNVTLRLTDVPWDQALELVLETAGLGKRQEGNVLRILPIEKMRDEEQAKIEAEQMRVDQGVLESRVYPISYASVEDMEGYLDNLKSDRGSIVADSRNKQLIVRDVAPVHDQMAEMVAHIDKPERQVMIEARIVEANTNFSKDLGVQWNFDYQDSDIGRGEVPNQNWNMLTNSTGMGGSFWIPVTDPASAGFATEMIFGALDGNLDIGLRLSALESSGDVRVISTPRVTTLNGQSASISQGTKIPYATVGDAGTNIEFEDAELKLEVTPEINPDGSIILDISASSSAIGSAVPVAGGLAMSIDAKDAQTKVLVRDGQTTVIGGVFIEDERDSNTGVPILKDIPIIGDLFKSTSKASSRKELLIFITPRIVET
ncbi:MAG: type IV pilus secretin PilQ, partial [Desulfuromonadales bacterium]|nr:type IV pilus secretin PilQ [Desulfuromonadales bacterium]